MQIKVAPSILAANWLALEGEIERATIAGADILHLDVMDGSFVPPISFGQDMVKAIRKATKLPLDVHLMIDSPEKHIDSFIDAGADYLSFHIEATKHAHRLVQGIQSKGVKAGIVLCPATPVVAIEELMAFVDYVLVMTINPGWGGQKLIPETIDKIRRIKALIPAGRTVEIEVDGGIIPETSKACRDAGANMLVSGSYLFNSADMKKAVQSLKD